MCGIVGYVGPKNAQDILLDGLKRLEYRGYDSSGIVTLAEHATLLRAKGKVAELESKVNNNKSQDGIGIGHTRWATHGEPNEINAHPHHVGDIYLAHNGIIENYKDLKHELPDYDFQSQTDSEVLAALIDSLYKREDVKLENAVTQALKLVEGTYGIVVVSPREPGKIIVARNGSPLIIGVGDDETIVASDAAALIAHTEDAIYLNDGELAVCTAGNVDVLNLDEQPISAIVEKIETNLDAIEKQGYDHFLIKEIMEQSETVRSTLSGRVLKDQHILRLGGLNMSQDDLKGVENIFIVACGTASYAGQLASYYIEQVCDDVTIRNEVASELRYRSFNVPKNSIAIFVSQSGETADTRACLQEMKKRSVRCLGVINAVGSTIAREVDGGVYVHAGPEISVASTKAFTSQVSALMLIGLVMAQAKGLSQEVLNQYIDEFDALPEELRRVLDRHDDIKAIAKDYQEYEHAFYLGRDTMFPVALEGALKLKETSYIHTEGQAAGELKHGSIALIDDRFFEVAFIDEHRLFEKSMSNIIEVNSRGGHVVVVTNSQSQDIEAEAIIRIDSPLKLLTPLLLNVVSQLFAYYIATARGNDVDQPRNLAKSVTVE